MSTSGGYRQLGQEEGLDGLRHGGTSPGSSKWIWLWRSINLVMTVFFLLAAYVNLNDPDPYVWVPLYLIPGVLCFAIFVKPEVNGNPWWKGASSVHGILCMMGACYLLAVLLGIMKEVSNPLHHEEGRELAGLIITAAWLGVCRMVVFDSGSSGVSTNSLVIVTAILGLLPLVMWGLCFVEGLDRKLGHCKDMFPGV